MLYQNGVKLYFVDKYYTACEQFDSNNSGMRHFDKIIKLGYKMIL